jgi:hypothetical protein
MKEQGSISILLATYLSIVLLSVIGFSSVGVAILASHRVQGVADFAVLYGHDRAVRAGQPDLSRLRFHVQEFIRTTPSASRLEILQSEAWISGEASHVRICARYQDLFGLKLNSMALCREASAKSFLVL